MSSLLYNVAGSAYGLTYTYDAAGNRIQLGSELGRTGVPAGMSSAAYDPADELTTWNGVALPSNPYDNNGNLSHDGTYDCTWNARNQLVTIKNHATRAVVASFLYDSFGRRVQKTLVARRRASSTTGSTLSRSSEAR